MEAGIEPAVAVLQTAALTTWLIQRRAYGFRNFENYRMRVIAQCG